MVFCKPLPLVWLVIQEEFYFVDRSHGFAHHGDRCADGCEAQTNFTDESMFLMADDV
jgi:hypothetical protein